MAQTTTTAEAATPTLEQPVSTHRAIKMVERNVLAYKHYWTAFISGFFLAALSPLAPPTDNQVGGCSSTSRSRRR